MRSILLVVLASVLVGCLEYETHVRIAPDGQFNGHLMFSAPDWLLARWGYGGDRKSASTAMAQAQLQRTKKAGRGIWISGDNVTSWQTPFANWKFKVEEQQWSFAGAVTIETQELQEIKQEMERQASQRLGGRSSNRMGRLARAMYGNSNLDIYIQMPYEVLDTNGDRMANNVLHWEIPFAAIEQGTQLLIAHGTMRPSDHWRLLLASLLPNNEPD